MNNWFSELMFIGFWISLILAPFTGVTLVTAVCFLIIGNVTASR